MISMESGELVLSDCDNIDVVRAHSLADIREAYEYVLEHKNDYDTVAIDSLTELGDIIDTELKANPEYQGMANGIKMWGAYTDVMMKIARSFRDIDGLNVVLIALEESVKEGFNETVVPALPAKKAQNKLPALYDEVIYININEDGEREFICQPTEHILAKDRSGKLPAVVPYLREDGLKPIFDIINS
jgi:hypothetical protein